jgi:2,3-bisphosphoglycerate-independent phosphoglycerate mutase
MSAFDIAAKITAELESEWPDFVCLNFANTDMVGHTGVFKAAVKAAEAADKCLEKVVTTALAHNYTSIIIADHGNSDMMINPDGTPNTQHTTNLVPFIIVDPEFATGAANKPVHGVLGDVATTILELMSIEKPKEMTGKVLIAAQ